VSPGTSSVIARRLAVASALLLPSCDPDLVPPTPSGTASIVVDFPGTTATYPPLLLYSGREGTTCEKYEPDVANPTVTLVDVSDEPLCRVEIDVFSPMRGAFARDIDAAAIGDEDWLLDAINAGVLSITPPSLRRVPIHIWLVTGSGLLAQVEAVRDRLLNKAYPVLEMLGTGLTLDTVSTTLSPTALTANCRAAGSISTNSAIYDASRINVYFVFYYGNNPGLTPARNCWIESYPEIVFISWGDPNVTDPTLVHELGHALGLIHPTLITGGHTDYTAGFNAFNLMASNTDVLDISIGQLYALNFSSDSWLNRSGSPLSANVVLTCSDTWAATPCPSLKMFQAGWP
jgi:hypothetical protein